MHDLIYFQHSQYYDGPDLYSWSSVTWQNLSGKEKKTNVSRRHTIVIIELSHYQTLTTT